MTKVAKRSITADLSAAASVIVNDIGTRVSRLQSRHDMMLAALEKYATGFSDGGKVAAMALRLLGEEP